MTSYFVTSDRKTLVPEGDPRAAFGVQPKDLKRLGLSDQVGGFTPPDAPEPQVMRSANEPEPTEPEPDVKEAPPPADKAVKKPATKGAARKDNN